MYDKFYVYIPREVSKDFAFPFKPDQKLKVRIEVENTPFYVMVPDMNWVAR
jgi:hypothetical protein